MVPVGANRNVILDVALLGSCDLLHFSNFRHAKLGVVVEECTTTQNGEVVLGPVPQLTQVLVVQCIEGIIAKKKKKEEINR